MIRLPHRTSTTAEPTDAELLRRFTTTRDEAAFAALVRRHGRLVLGVCRHHVRQEQDAEDAFQATFLALARKASVLHKKTSLASWLHVVARRNALEIRRKDARRRAHEKNAPSLNRPESDIDLAIRELQVILDEEVQRLPEIYRAPMILCCFEGLSKAEAAARLGWKEGTVSGRLARARERLREQLTRRDLTLTAALCAAELSRASAAVPATLAEATVSAAAQQALDLPIVALIGSILRTLALTRGQFAAILLIVAGLTAAGVGALVPTERPAPPAPAVQDKQQPILAAQAQGPRVDLFGDPLPPGAVARLGTVRFRHSGYVTALSYAPDGKKLATVGDLHSGRNFLCLWDPSTGKQLHRVMPLEDSDNGRVYLSWCVSFSPNGKILAAGTHSGLALWDETGKLLRQVKLHESRVRAVAVSPDSRIVATCSEDESVCLWNVAENREVRRLKGHVGGALAATFSLDGRFLACGAEDGSVRLWDLVDMEVSRQLVGHAGGVTSIVFTPDGKTLASGSKDGSIRFWDPNTGKELRRFQIRDGAVNTLAIAFSPNGMRLAASGNWYIEKGARVCTGALKVWDLTSGKELPQFAERIEPCSAIAFSPDGKTLASSQNERLRLWDVETGKDACEHGYLEAGWAPLLMSDGKTVLAGSHWSECLRFWDLSTGREMFGFPQTKNAAPPVLVRSMFRRVALTQGGKQLIDTEWQSDSLLLRFWDLSGLEFGMRKSKELFQVRVQTRPGFYAFTPDGGTMAIAPFGGESVRLWDTTTGREQGRLKDNGPTIALSFSPDGKVLATGHEESVRLWDAETVTELRRIPDNQRMQIRQLAFSPRREFLAGVEAGYERESLWVMEVNTGKYLWREDHGHKGNAKWPKVHGQGRPAFSPDGRTLATSDFFGSALLWEVASGKERATLQGHASVITSFVFTPDGKRLISGSWDFTTLVWDLALGAGADPNIASKLSEEELQRLWKLIAGEDARAAYKAILMLSATDKAVPLLLERLRPSPVDEKRVRQFIAELDSKRFTDRQKATAELEKLGEGVVPFLRRALAGQITLEMRQRLEGLVQRLEPELSRRLPEVRALESLELAGTPAARAALRELASGAPEVWLTREARKCLKRLER